MPFYQPPQEPIELRARFVIDRPLVERALFEVYRSMKVFRGAQLLIALLGLGLCIVCWQINDEVGWLFGLIGLGTFLWVAWRIPQNNVRRASRLFYPENSQGVFGARVVELSTNTLTLGSDIGSMHWNLGAVYKVSRYPDMLILQPAPALFVPIPAFADFDRDNFETFADKLSALYSRAVDTYRQQGS
jgi:hypothetical protein